ncbi:MAG: hypothetical protein OXU61_12770 [Gammaproteobacteria bacterium]|nr:hypothetical protein [Gammaproteobacteria bacterium]
MKLGESMDLQHAKEIMPTSRGHRIYQDAYEIYSKYIESHQFPHIPSNGNLPFNINSVISNALDRNKAIFAHANKFWERYLDKSSSWELLAWKRSLQAHSEAEIRKLNSLYDKFMPIFTRTTDQFPMPASTFLAHSFPITSMHEAIFSRTLLSGAQEKYATYTAYQYQRAAAAQTFANHRDFLQPTIRRLLLSTMSDEQYSICAKRIFLEYGFTVFLYYVLAYPELLPHNTYGRYPSLIDSIPTAKTYESHSEHVLFYVFIDMPYHVEQLKTQSSKMDLLWEMGHKNNCW